MLLKCLFIKMLCILFHFFFFFTHNQKYDIIEVILMCLLCFSVSYEICDGIFVFSDTSNAQLRQNVNGINELYSGGYGFIEMGGKVIVFKTLVCTHLFGNYIRKIKNLNQTIIIIEYIFHISDYGSCVQWILYFWVVYYNPVYT